MVVVPFKGFQKETPRQHTDDRIQEEFILAKKKHGLARGDWEEIKEKNEVMEDQDEEEGTEE